MLAGSIFENRLTPTAIGLLCFTFSVCQTWAVINGFLRGSLGLFNREFHRKQFNFLFYLVVAIQSLALLVALFIGYFMFKAALSI